MSAPVKVSKALEEVWQWKEEAWQEVAHLPLRQALRKRMEIAERTARELGFEPVPRALPGTKVAETSAKYTAKRKKNR